MFGKPVSTRSRKEPGLHCDPIPSKCVQTSLGGFARDRNGNIAILFAFMTTVLFLFVGGAVDYTRWNSVRADMIESMDAASLAVAQLAASDSTISKADLEDYGERFFKENFNYESDLVTGWSIVFSLADDAVISTCVDGKIDTYLLGVAGINELDIGKCVEITKKGSGRIELALVLDVTGSMDSSIDGTKKIDSLKDAVDELLQVMFVNESTSENLKIGVVPFNSYVNAGGASSWVSTWGDTNANAYYHGARFFHVDENGNIDVNRKVNHYDLYDTVPTETWKGCVEARPYPLDELDIAPGGSVSSTDINDALTTPSDYTGADNSDEDDRNYDAFNDAPSIAISMGSLANANNLRWVPQFHPDEVDCNNSYDCETDSDYNNMTGSTSDGITWFGYFFDDPDEDVSHPSGTIYESAYPNKYFVNDNNYTHYNNSPDFDKYTKIVKYFRDVTDPSGPIDDADFEDFIEKFTLEAVPSSHAKGKQEYILRNAYVGWWDPATETYKYKYDNPNSGLGDSKGPNLNCSDPILPLTNVRQDIRDAVQALSPGGYTNSAHGAAWGWRVLSSKAPFTEGIAPSDPDYNDWQKAVVIMTDGENTVESQSTHWDSGLASYGYAIESRMGANMTSRSDMRDEIDNKLLRICHRMKEEGYLIYTIMFGLESTSTERVFKACATEPTAPYFHDAVDGDDLEDAFGDIAKDLVDLHISK